MKVFFLVLAALPLAAQVPSTKTWLAPRAADGKPDLQGVWTSATLTPLENGRARIQLDEPQKAVTPGQAAVFYDGDIVVGGGWICRTAALQFA